MDISDPPRQAQKSGAAPLTERPFSKTQLFCSNLPWSVNGKVCLFFAFTHMQNLKNSLCTQMLRQAFEEHGEVVDAFVAYNGRSSRGFGYVTFKNPQDATAALKAQQEGRVSKHCSTSGCDNALNYGSTAYGFLAQVVSLGDEETEVQACHLIQSEVRCRAVTEEYVCECVLGSVPEKFASKWPVNGLDHVQSLANAVSSIYMRPYTCGQPVTGHGEQTALNAFRVCALVFSW